MCVRVHSLVCMFVVYVRAYIKVSMFVVYVQACIREPEAVIRCFLLFFFTYFL